MTNLRNHLFTGTLGRVILCAIAGTGGCLWAQDTSIRVAEPELKKAAVTKVNPEYPAIARQLHLAGRAEVEVYVTPDGDVEKVQPLSGNPIFTNSAISAVKKWKFTPFKADGKPAKAVGTLTFSFTG
jgi:TonB family protein